MDLNPWAVATAAIYVLPILEDMTRFHELKRDVLEDMEMHGPYWPGLAGYVALFQSLLWPLGCVINALFPDYDK